GDGFRPIARAVARITGHHLPTAEIRLIDLIDHQHHPARGLLPRRIDGVSLEAFALRRMTVDAIQVGGGRKEPHRVHELPDGDSLEYLDVLENILRHQGLFLTAGRYGNEQAGRGECKSLVHRLVGSPLATPNAGSLIVFM